MGLDVDGLTGRIVTPADPDYPLARQGYNRGVQHFPAVIDYCATRWDVRNAVNWAVRRCAPLRVRSGTHHYEGYSNGNGVLVIDVSRMNGLELMESEGLLYVQAGVTNREVYEFLAARGYPFPGGTCPTVGLSGYAAGGGWGLSCRMFGLGCDSLEELELVGADGEFLTADRNRNPDLFWACRGAGGGNFGALVSMTFRLPPRRERVTLIEISYPHEVPESEQAAFLLAWQEWLSIAGPRMTLQGRIFNSEDAGHSMLARGFFYGPPKEAEAILRPFLRLNGAKASVKELPFLEAVNAIGSTYPPFEKFQSVSRFARKNLSTKEAASLVALIQERAPGSIYAGLSLYALGGKVAEIASDETAFYYRDAKYILWLNTMWEDQHFAEANDAWIRERFPEFAAPTCGSYGNFPYGELPDYLAEYYGANVPRLREVKSKYDPGNVFSFPQEIPGASPVTMARRSEM